MDEGIKFDDAKLQELLAKIGAMFLEFGIRNLNMDDISRNLKISKKTLYQYFKSKEDLIEKLFEYDELRWNAEFRKIDANQLNAIDIMLFASSMVAKELKDQLNPKLKFELKKYYEPIYQRFWSRKQNHILENISKNIRKGIEEGLYRADVNVELTASLYVRNLIEVNNQDFCMIKNTSFEQVFEVMFETHIRAIATPEGIAYFERRKAEILGNK
jgi:TetR/AcrR family transcriptional regulator, cholesterol catabolism regulator